MNIPPNEVDRYQRTIEAGDVDYTGYDVVEDLLKRFPALATQRLTNGELPLQILLRRADRGLFV